METDLFYLYLQHIHYRSSAAGYSDEFSHGNPVHLRRNLQHLRGGTHPIVPPTVRRLCILREQSVFECHFGTRALHSALEFPPATEDIAAPQNKGCVASRSLLYIGRIVLGLGCSTYRLVDFHRRKRSILHCSTRL